MPNVEIDRIERAGRSIFQDVLELLVGHTKTEVIFEDLTGFTFDSPEFSLEQKFRRHCSNFCSSAKTASIRHCAGNKRICNRLASSRGVGFDGMCYLGIYEAVKPLRVDGKILGVFYFGSVVLKETEAYGEARIRRYCERYKIDPAAYLERYAKVLRVDKKAWMEMKILFDRAVSLLTHLVENLAPPVGGYALHKITKEARQERRQGPLTQKAIRHVSQHFSKDCTLSDSARALGCHPVHLSRTFKGEVGVDFHQYVHQVRITHAKRLLHTRNMNVTRVAYEVGYADSSHFCRIFKQATGQTPTEFIRNAERV
jgi:AraC-like DNA-binding protein